MSELRPDSIHLIRPGKGYQGAEIYHMNDDNIIECVSETDKESLDKGTMPTSLWDAVRCFMIMSSIKRLRAEKIKENYSDMIIHSFIQKLSYDF